MNAIGYVRRSKKSDDRTVSLETQRAAISAYCDRLGFVLLDFVQDDGVSGTKRKRFDNLKNSYDSHKPKIVVVYSLDRLARDSAGLTDYLRSLVKAGAELHEVLGGVVDFKRAVGRMVTGIRGVTDQFYAEMIGEKTSEALGFLRAAQAKYTNIPPLGWCYLDGKMVEVAEEQHALEVLRRCKAAGLGARRALRVLEAGGYSGRKSLGVIHKTLQGVNHEFEK